MEDSEKTNSVELKQSIKVATFDFDGTLYPSSAGIESQIKKRFRMCARKRLGISGKDLLKLLTKYRKKYRSSIIGLEKHHGIDAYDFYEELYGGLDISSMTPKPGLQIALKRLSEKIPIYVFSNSNRSFVRRGLKHLELSEYFTDLITVEDNNFIRKPNHEVYKSTIERLGVSGENICMFDDIASSLKTAKETDFLTILVSNGLSETGFIDLHTGIEHKNAPKWCDYATRNIADFILNNMISK